MSKEREHRVPFHSQCGQSKSFSDSFAMVSGEVEDAAANGERPIELAALPAQRGRRTGKDQLDHLSYRDRLRFDTPASHTPSAASLSLFSNVRERRLARPRAAVRRPG